ncbi:MAG: TonB-dependent receptor [Caulobacteraceae bacterium]|nr:TonB-dependent receptor [Caulobacteraceae bacterium]
MKRHISVGQLKAGVAAAALLAAAGPGIAGAADAPPSASNGAAGTVEEVVVTAQKRAEAVQTVPMAITAFTSRTLVTSGVTTFQDYAVRVPNLAFAYSSSLGANAQAIAIRGIYGQNTTGMYLDDTPLPMSVDPRVLDLSRIEVLKGPQGTLYGARSMGGTVRLITNQPDAGGEEGYLHAVGSSTEHGGTNGQVDGAINLPLIKDHLAVRVNAYDDYESGVFDRVASAGAPVDYGTHKGIGSSHHDGGSVAASLSLLDDKLVITPRYMFEDMREDGHPYADYTAGNFTQHRLFNMDEPGSESWKLYSLTAKYQTPYGEITSNTAQFIRHSSDSEDSSEVVQLFFGTPAIPVRFNVQGRNSNFSQELRFTSSLPGPFQITAGAFYQNSDSLVVFPPTPLGNLVSDLYDERLDTRVRETAVFGEATYDLTSKLRLIAGARWFDNTIAFNGEEGGVAVTPGVFVGSQHQTGINPKFGLQYKVTGADMVYATAAKGFRIGGVNSFSDTLCAADLASLGLTADKAKTYASDELWNYEVGAKTSWLDRRLTVDAALFDIEWSNVQQSVALPTCGFSVSVNGGHARSRGGELEVQAAVTSSLKLSMGAGYTDAQITDPGPNHIVTAGTPIQQVPKWTFNAAADYRFEAVNVPAFIHADFAYVDSSLSANNDATNPRLRPAYSLVNVRTGVDVNRVELTLFVDNVFDQHANYADVPPQAIELPGRPRIATNRPRTVGVDARVKF